MVNKFIIYCLIDPRHEDIFYIGRSSSGLRRAKHHLQDSVFKKKNYPVYKKIREIKQEGYEPYIEILEEAENNDELNIFERYYINLYRKRECGRLVNIADGGKGCLGRKVSQEIKDRLSKLYKGKKQSKEFCKKISEAMKNKKVTEVTKQILSLASKKRMSIICVETNEIFHSIRQAAKEYNCDHRGLARCCNGEYSQYKGFHWKYL